MTEPYIKAIPFFQSGGLSDEETPPSSTIIGYLPMIMDQEDHVHTYALSEHRRLTKLHEFIVDTEEEAITLYENHKGEFDKSACSSCRLMKLYVT